MGYARLRVHGGSLLAGFRPGLVTGRIARPVRSRRSQISTATGTSPLGCVVETSTAAQFPRRTKSPQNIDRHLSGRQGHFRLRCSRSERCAVTQKLHTLTQRTVNMFASTDPSARLTSTVSPRL
jgi:hypothetical protein